MATRAKLAGMGLVLALSVVLAIAGGRTWHWLVCAALGFSWVGDAMLAHYPPIAGRIRDPFIAGMASFACAQAVYIAAFRASLFGMPPLHMRIPGSLIGIEIVGLLLPVYLLAALVFWTFSVLRAERAWALKAGTLVYALLLAAMAAYACAAAFTGVSFVWPLPLGGVLFLISDAWIALRIFQNRFPSETKYQWAVWGTYVPAQLCLLLGTALLY